jgi:hypothetical protein
MKKALLFSCFAIFLLGCSEREEIATKEKVESVSLEDKSLEVKKQKIYKASVQNESTIQDFLVVKVFNKSTGETKEVCTKGNFLSGAIHLEYGFDYTEKGVARVKEIILNSKDRTFELSDEKALNNIGFNDYSKEELKTMESRVEAGSYTYRSDKEMTMLAHILFNKGIKSSESSCWGGELEFEKE